MIYAVDYVASGHQSRSRGRRAASAPASSGRRRAVSPSTSPSRCRRVASAPASRGLRRAISTSPSTSPFRGRRDASAPASRGLRRAVSTSPSTSPSRGRRDASAPASRGRRRAVSTAPSTSPCRCRRDASAPASRGRRRAVSPSTSPSRCRRATSAPPFHVSAAVSRSLSAAEVYFDCTCPCFQGLGLLINAHVSDLLLVVFGFLPARSRARLRLTCRSWRCALEKSPMETWAVYLIEQMRDSESIQDVLNRTITKRGFNLFVVYAMKLMKKAGGWAPEKWTRERLIAYLTHNK